MLDLIRRGINTWAFKGLLVLLIASFAFWGMQDFQRGPEDQGDGPVAEVGEQTISARQVRRTFRSEIQRLEEQFDTELERAEAREMGLLDRAVDRLVNRELYALAAQEAGLRASDAMLETALRNESAFQGPDGEFDPQLFQRNLRASGLTEQQLLGQLREDLVRQPLTAALTAGTTPPEPYLNRLFVLENERRSADLLTIDVSAITDISEPSQSELRAYHEENPEPFTAPEYRAVTAITFDVQNIAARVDIPEQRIQEEWERVRNERSEPDQARVQQAILDDEATAQAVAEQARNGADLSAAVAAVTDAPGAEPFDLGWVTPDDLTGELADAVFSTEPESFGGPVETSLGWHVFYVAEVEEGETNVTFEEVEDDIRQRVLREEGQQELFDLAIEIEDALAGGADFQEIARDFPVARHSVQAIDRQGRTRDGREPDWAHEELLTTAFELGTGETSQLIDTREHGYYAVRVDNIREPQLRPFQDVADQVRDAWAADQRRQVAAERAEDLAQALRDGDDPAALADTRQAVTYRAIDGVSRQEAAMEELPGDLVAALFRAEEGSTVTAGGSDRHYAGLLTGITTPEPESGDDALNELRDRLGQQLANDFRSQYEQALRDRFDVTIHEDRLAAIE